MSLSLVIPTLNESDALADTLAAIRAEASAGPVEVIVADCGSTDDTADVAGRAGVRVVRGPVLTCRARACNAGARVARGGVLLFLHADSRVPRGYDRLIQRTLAAPGVIGGAFEFALAGPQWRLRFVETVNRARYRVQGRFFGDQGIFIRRDVFECVGGFPDVPIMEDARFCRTVWRSGRMCLVPVKMWTSPRRFYNGGILRTLAFDTVVWIGDALGFNLDALAEVYRRDNVRRGVLLNSAPSSRQRRTASQK